MGDGLIKDSIEKAHSFNLPRSASHTLSAENNQLHTPNVSSFKLNSYNADDHKFDIQQNYTTLNKKLRYKLSNFQQSRMAHKPYKDISSPSTPPSISPTPCSPTLKCSEFLNLHPNRVAPKRPIENDKLTSVSHTTSINNCDKLKSTTSRRPSLSARRGMRLSLNKLGLKETTENKNKKLHSHKDNNEKDYLMFKTKQTDTVTGTGSNTNVAPPSTLSALDVCDNYDDDDDDDNDMFSHQMATPLTPANLPLEMDLGKQEANEFTNFSGGVFESFAPFLDIDTGSINFEGKLSLSPQGIEYSNGSSSKFSIDDFEYLEKLGEGNYGQVFKVLHKTTGIIMALKKIKLELETSKLNQISMELEVLHNCNSPYVIDFYGAFFVEGTVYICMEYMDGGSLSSVTEKNKKLTHADCDDTSLQISGIEEQQLSKIAESIIRGLMELKDSHNIMHRDVKPSNIVYSKTEGSIKLCDFGVSGNLVASLAKTNIGCQSYMAPERINSNDQTSVPYSVHSDIWSLGITIVELALGYYPYPAEIYDNIFSQLNAIVSGPVPTLPSDKFSTNAQDFISLCLKKIHTKDGHIKNY
ncbi:hypothetical protein TPHA_0B03130 [Tetrapisispora phaffii CBS 4417]|uniref:mitogen-activated protein kinase kinase n=1 Tax=Tetrapisispora phaffii (strain ATCC 24235 / CBS 4417 / NBRC 1672 / NRRL Y-8282 / UCD 70-5) TaxID=1071381 RepID=G8BPQ4_TETPH|nr:hypothetical protein TPHA_0B03130 [Tetrapisispora phaffii CBS 4417]CCE61985.1 hypothetical protein TPHA_0B03130 [Tetrapisispora phaffii CBS 4417]